MKSWLKYICLFACCMPMLSSCVLDEEVVDVAESCQATVELTLSYSDDSPMSRDVSPNDDGSIPSLDYTTLEQKYLDEEDIFVLAFEALENNSDNTGYDTDKFLGLVEDLSFVTESGVKKLRGRINPQKFTSGINVYFAVLTNLSQNEIKDADGNEVTDMVAFLNGMMGQTSEDVYKELIYNTNDGKWLDDYNETTKEWEPRIPMWGKTGVSQLNYSSDIDFGNCDLYRAVAKVQIWIGNRSGLTGPNGEAFKITKITIQNANSKGYCVSLNEPDRDINKQYTVASVPGYSSLGDIVYDDLEVTTVYSDMIYIPEHINSGENATPIKILVEYTYNGTNYTGDKAGVIEFYDADGAYNVIRNHSYVFNITGISEPVNPELQYQVMNWTSVPNPDLYFGNSDGNVNN